MFSMTDWVYMLKTVFKVNLSSNKIQSIIKQNCLVSQQKYYGTYIVNHQKVWDNIVETDAVLKQKLKEKNITDYMGIMSYYEEIKYKQMRFTFPRNYHKHG